ncbi:MAG TPA: DMT family transporter [Nitrospirota bacterium]|nr:DMT family transporter [Nitrospirota bacterium]
MANYLKIIFAMLIWSTWGPMIRWMALPPAVVLFYTSLIASFLVPLVLRLRGDFPEAIMSLKSWHLFVGLSIASITNNISYFFSLGHTTVSNAVFTHYTAPVFVAALAPILISERLQRVTLISLPLAVLGMIMIVVAGGNLSLDSVHTVGIAAGTLSGLAYAFVIMFSRRLSQLLLHHKAIIVNLWITAAVTAPAALTTDHHMSYRAGALLLVTGLFHSNLAPLLYFNALRKVIAQHAAILGYMEPLAAIPLAFFFLSETPTLITLFGGILILVSGYMVMHYGKGSENLPTAE